DSPLETFDLRRRFSCRRSVCTSLVLAFALCALSAYSTVLSQGRQIFTLFGDIKVDTSKTDEPVPLSLDVFLYKSGSIIGRQRLGNNDRYRFNNLSAGSYEVAVEIDNREVARVSTLIAGQVADDIRLDLNLAYRKTIERKVGGGEVISIDETYPRNGRNNTLHQKSIREVEQKNYAEAVATLRELVDLDPKDYQAWFELGAIYFIRKEYEAAEKSFISSSIALPTYLPAHLNLGRVRLARKNFEGAIDALEK